MPWKARQARFVCRFYDNGSADGTLIPVSIIGRNNRGESLSEYAKLYGSHNDVLDEELGGGDSGQTSSNGRSIYANAIQRLHVSVLPEVLPCRTIEKDKVMTYLRSGLSRGGNIRPLYISGMPGTGKTACFLAAVKTLQEERRLRQISNDPPQSSALDSTSSSATGEELPNFEFIEINCLRLHSPYEAYSMLWRGLSGERVSPKTALQRLSDRFQNNHKRTDDTISIVLLDELDFLVSGNESVVYNFFDWPQLPKSCMIVVGIANTMDLPERLTLRARSRLGGDQANRMVFQPYSHEQVRNCFFFHVLAWFHDKFAFLTGERNSHRETCKFGCI
jgi:origin recognition complex subunit 1